MKEDHRSCIHNFSSREKKACNCKSCVYNCDDLLSYYRSNTVALRFGGHKTKEMLGVVLTGFKLCATTPKNVQHGVQTDATCNIQQCWELPANNVACVCTGLKRIYFKTVQPSRFLSILLENPESRPIRDWDRENPDFDICSDISIWILMIRTRTHNRVYLTKTDI